MSGIPTVAIFLLAGVFLTLIALGVLSNIIARNSRVWNVLPQRFPEQPPALDAVRGKASISSHRVDPRRGGFKSPSFFTSGLRLGENIEYESDADYLHITPLFGPTGRGRRVSIPWAQIKFLWTAKSHLGDIAALDVTDAMLIVPVEMVREELAVREAIEKANPSEQSTRNDNEPPMIDAPPRT